jgi:effector-binding domain-containing protein
MSAASVIIVDASPLPLAAVRRQVTMSTLANTVIAAPIWSLSRERGLNATGETVVIYHDDGTELLQHSPDGVTIDVGVLQDEPFADDMVLRCVMTPAGRAAYARHAGSYDRLRATHGNIRDWCAAAGHALAGPNWEHYVYWNEDPSKLVTDVFYLLA